MTNTPKVALVTGGSSGIGKAIVEQYVREGIAVVIADVADAEGKELAQRLTDNGGKAEYIHCDVSSPEQNQQVVDYAMKTFGRLDYAVNNAGIGGEQNPTADYSIDGWKQVMDINLNGVFYGMKAQIPAMLSSGGGSIVNVSSILGAVAFAGAPAYTTSKHALLGLTKAAALDYGAQGIRINAVGPAFINTPMIQEVLDNPVIGPVLPSLHALGRIGEPHEVAELVCFLTSERASFMTGTYYPVDGGYLTR